MDLDQAKTYLARVMPWPQEGDEPAYVNIHYTFVPKDGLRPGQDKLPWAGRAVRTLSEAVDALSWAAKNEGTRDIYACLSTQRHAIEQTGKNNFKYYKPIRGQDNAVTLTPLFGIGVFEKDLRSVALIHLQLAFFQVIVALLHLQRALPEVRCYGFEIILYCLRGFPAPLTLAASIH